MTTYVAPGDERLTPEEAAEYLGVKTQTLAAWRSSGRYELRFIRAGRCIRYRKSDLDAWMERRSATSVAAAKKRLE